MERSNSKRPKPVVLAILDGWGVNQHYNGNAITLARVPVFKNLISEYPITTLRASGESVGLPWGEMGNSEVGHLNLGLGRILYQDLPRINKAINDKSFYKNEVLLKAIEHTRKNNSDLHIMGLVSNGSVHSSIDHLHALIVMAGKNKVRNMYLHVILDGRDVSYNSGLNFIQGIQGTLNENNAGTIASLAGRFYTMDRNNNWDRIAKSYYAYTEGAGNIAEDAIKAIEQSYKKKIYDEEFVPTVIHKDKKPVALIKENDAVIFFNYRPDRGRQITKAFVLPEFDKFKRNKFLQNLFFVTFTEYEKGLPVEIAFPLETLNNTLGEVISRAKLKQLRIAETEKYAHVTYFFNGGRENKFDGEDHILVPSPAVSSYDQKPEMSAETVTKKLIDSINTDKYDFILVNYANADMVGHTGNIKAGIASVEMVDKCLGKLIKAVLDKNGAMLITADHGNAEDMYNMQTGQMDKEHSSNPVPLILVGKDYQGKNVGWPNVVGGDLSTVMPQGILSDVAPTVLHLLGLKKPKEMTGLSLL